MEHEHYRGWIILKQETTQMSLIFCSVLPEIPIPYLVTKWYCVGTFKYPETAIAEAKRLIDWIYAEIEFRTTQVIDDFRKGEISPFVESEDEP